MNNSLINSNDSVLEKSLGSPPRILGNPLSGSSIKFSFKSISFPFDNA